MKLSSSYLFTTNTPSLYLVSVMGDYSKERKKRKFLILLEIPEEFLPVYFFIKKVSLTILLVRDESNCLLGML